MCKQTTKVQILQFLYSVQRWLHSDVQSCDPFPTFLIREGIKDYLSTDVLLRELPTFRSFASKITSIPTPSLRLLDWLFTHTAATKLTSISWQQFEKESHFPRKYRPNAIFSVTYSDGPHTRTFEALKKEHGSILAYHGSSLCNFHSILNNGLRTRHCKEDQVLFGQGVYLSTDATVGMNFLQSGQGWKLSEFGTSFGCIAACEVIKHPDVLLSQLDMKDPQASALVMSLTEKLPRTYVLVRRDELVRVKHLLIYRNDGQASAGKKFMFLVLVLYLLLLAFLALTLSQTHISRR